MGGVIVQLLVGVGSEIAVTTKGESLSKYIELSFEETTFVVRSKTAFVSPINWSICSLLSVHAWCMFP